MKKNPQLIILAAICLAIALSSLPALSQEPEVKPALLEQPMPDFTLPTFQGGSVSLSSLKGKNVLIVFPRGFAAEGRWCTICNYKYAELVDFEKTEQLRKNPPEADRQDDKLKARMEMARKGFPKDLSAEKGKVPVPFPVLIDKDRKVTKGLGLFAAEWSGSKVDQLIPSVFVVNKEGILIFKYIGQNTWDRPSWEYMEKVLEATTAK